MLIPAQTRIRPGHFTVCRGVGLLPFGIHCPFVSEYRQKLASSDQSTWFQKPLLRLVRANLSLALRCARVRRGLVGRILWTSPMRCTDLQTVICETVRPLFLSILAATPRVDPVLFLVIALLMLLKSDVESLLGRPDLGRSSILPVVQYFFQALCAVLRGTWYCSSISRQVWPAWRRFTASSLCSMRVCLTILCQIQLDNTKLISQILLNLVGGKLLWDKWVAGGY